jgi:hypothetical protein
LRNAKIAFDADPSGSPIILVDFERLYNDVFTLRKPRIVVTGREPATGDQDLSLQFPLTSLIGKASDEYSTVMEVLGQGLRFRIGA